MISSFISPYFLSTLFNKTNLSWLICEAKLWILTSTVYNLVFANNIILTCFFFFFLRIDLYFLIIAVIAQIFNPTAEFAMPIGIKAKEVKAKTHPVIAEA